MTRDKFLPIRAPRMLGEEVTRQIRDAIMSGAYGRGQKVVAAEVANRMGVSTTPVREALAALAHEGILQVNPRRSFRVALLSKTDIQDIFGMEAFLAGVFARRAADVIDDKRLQRLRRFQARVDKIASEPQANSSRARIEHLNYAFHRTINRSVDAPRLDWFWRAATQYIPRHIYETIPMWTQLTVVDHPGIIAALAERNSDLADRLATEHVLHAGDQVIANLEARDFFAARTTDGHTANDRLDGRRVP